MSVWCFAVSAVFRKRCLAAGFLLFIRSSSSNQNWTKSKLDKIGFGFQKGRFGLWLLLRLYFAFSACFKKGGTWLLLYYRQQQQSKLEIKIGQNWRHFRRGVSAPGNHFYIGFQKGRFCCYCDGVRNFRHERWCFAVSAVFRKRCVAAGFLLYL